MQVVPPTNNHFDRKSVNPSYSRLSEAFRHVTAGPLQCQVFCGGKSCKYERSDVWETDQMAIPGVFSHWVTKNILAMARPNCYEMKKNKILDSFKSSQISAIINLQESGEHASCGQALQPSGFSYDPQEFMDNGIFYYNFNIKDYSVPLQRTLLDICKVVAFSLLDGRVAVHCHAGLGRTGVVIACFFVYFHKMKPKDAILLVRKNRPRSIQTRNQLKAVFRFAMYLSPLWVQFSYLTPQYPPNRLHEILRNQQIVLHGLEARTLKYIPKLVYEICSWVLEQLGYSNDVLYLKIKSCTTRPYTCPSNYQFEVSDDLDSLFGDESVINVTEVDEIAQQCERTRRRHSSSGDIDRYKLQHSSSYNCEHSPADKEVGKLFGRLHISPRHSLNNFSTGLSSSPKNVDKAEGTPATGDAVDILSGAAEPQTKQPDNIHIADTTDNKHVVDVDTGSPDNNADNAAPADEVPPQPAPDNHTAGGDTSEKTSEETVTGQEDKQDNDKEVVKPELPSPEDMSSGENCKLGAAKDEASNNANNMNGDDVDDEVAIQAVSSSSTIHLVTHEITDSAREHIAQFLQGVMSKEPAGLDNVVHQINAGDWDVLKTQTPANMGALLRLWFETLSVPMISMFEIETIIRKSDMKVRSTELDQPSKRYLEKLNDAFSILSEQQVGTSHCLFTAFTLILHSSFKDVTTDIVHTLEYLVTQNNRETRDLHLISPKPSATSLNTEEGVAVSSHVLCANTGTVPLSQTPPRASEANEQTPPRASEANEQTPPRASEANEQQNKNAKLAVLLGDLLTYKYRLLIGDV